MEKEMATHSSILAWRIPWTEEPDGLHSMVSERVKHDWVTNTLQFEMKNENFSTFGSFKCNFMTHDVHMKYLSSHDRWGNYVQPPTCITGVLTLFYNRTKEKKANHCIFKKNSSTNLCQGILLHFCFLFPNG